jgi:deferrochelatase/peroxidase EfeB
MLTGDLALGNKASGSPGGARESVPFHGAHQAGIVTPQQDFLIFAAFDLTVNGITDVRDLFQAWTKAAVSLTKGQPVGSKGDNANLPPADTGEAAGLLPCKTTVTFGVGPSFFDARFGLADQRPAALVDIPPFVKDAIRNEWSGGDIGVQVCSNDAQVAFHAMRNLARIARGFAVMRWMQEGFQRTGQADPKRGTPRNLLGFIDGTANAVFESEEARKKFVWAGPGDGPSWMNNGSYMVTRRIRMRIEEWDRSTLRDQEATFGRHRNTGAPLGETDEFAPLDPNKKDASGKRMIPQTAHAGIAHGDGSVKLLRRSYSYSGGLDSQTGQLDAGLFFICYQRDPRQQFIAIQERLAGMDALNEYIEHRGSAIFACFPGVQPGGYMGETLF